ncbi:MAG: sugar ABC transporter permease [Chloroflexi bacterium]|nr:MAG: sugar ABC transporter permease [Chloroflexota bacterium]
MSVLQSSFSTQPATLWGRVKRWWFVRLEDETTLGYLLVIPILVVVFSFVGYPFFMAVFFSLTDRVLGQVEYNFVGLTNYINLAKDPVFRKTVVNTFNYTVTAVIFKLGLGILMALTLNEITRFRRIIRAAFLLPWVVPSSLSVLAWIWMFDSQFSIITYFARQLGIVDGKIPWLGDPALAMAAVQTVNIWRGVPFFGMALLAALVTVPKDLYDAATVDGASAFQKFRYVTLPSIMPILMVVTLFSFIQTMGDFQIVWILTKGGPINSTHLIATLAFRTAIQGSNVGVGAAIAVFLLPFLVAIIALQLRQLRRGE